MEEMTMRMTTEQKVKEALNRNIDIPSILLERENIVGIYGFFAVKENTEYCFYIGKATNMRTRIINQHIHQYLNNNFSKLVPEKIRDYLEEGYKIEVRILDEIDYRDTSFSKAAHRLALAELTKIVEYQKIGQCELQKLDGAKECEKTFWENNYVMK